MFRSRFLAFVVFVSMVVTLVPLSQPAAAVSTTIVISQVYGGGGNATATLKNDFIELFNRGTASVDLSTWSVQYAATAGTTWQKTNLTAVVLDPGRYYLVQEAQGTGGTQNLPTPDATGTIPMGAGAGKVALVSNQTTIISGTSCPTGSMLIDLVGYGTSTNCFEGLGPTPTLTNPTAASRKNAGCTETDDNSADFETGTPTPRNTASPLHFCTGDDAPAVTVTSPLDGAVGVGFNTNITIAFSEPVNVSTPWYTIVCATSGSHAAAQSGGPATFSLDPTTDFAFSENCTVTVLASQVTDQDAVDPPDNMLGNYTFSFTTEAPPPAPTLIHDIQGAGHVSPLKGQTPGNVPGIVTAKRSNGFYLQDPNPDTDPATSEGIFVFTISAPTSVSVGDAVRVRATVTEFTPGGISTANLSTTELASPTITVISHGNPIPAAAAVGTGGRVPPSDTIEDDATGNVETSGIFDPASDGLDFWESLEGMRIQLNNAVAVGPTNAFGETPVVGDDGANASVRTARGGVVIRPNDFNPERVVLDDAIVFPLPSANVGDHYAGSVEGVLDYNFGNFMIELTAMPAVVHDGVSPEMTTAAGTNQIAVATFNVENLAPSDPQSKFDRLAGLIVHNLKGPDVISVEEVQDNTGATDNGIVSASSTLAKLIAAIQAAGGPTYESRQIDPVDDQDGGAPGGNIRQVFLFRTDRGLSFVDRPGGGSTTPTTVVTGASGPELSFSPGRIDPTNSAWNTSRKPLAGEFMFNGHHLFIIANHFNSKGGDDPLMGRFQPPVRSSETQRHQQAQIVHDFVASILAADANASVVVDGDLNDFEFSDTVTILKTSVLTDLMETLPQNERYSYVFEGNSQTLDHILVSGALLGRPLVYDVVHVNSEFADQASDHEPSVVRITLNDSPSVSAGGPYSVNEGGSVAVAATATDPEGGALTFAWDLDNDGTFETPGQTATFAADDGPATRTVNVRATDTGGLSTTASTTVTVANVAPTATFHAPTSVLAGSDFTLSLTDSFDPSGADTAAGFTFAFDCGAGYAAFSSNPSVTCPTTVTGDRSVGGKIRDKDGGVTEYLATVHVVVNFESLCALARSYLTKAGVADSLCGKLESAAAARDRGNSKAAQNILNAFKNEVEAQRGKALTSENADTLIALADSL